MHPEDLGWGPALATAFHDLSVSLQLPALVPGRVLRQERGQLHVHLGDRQVPARPAGRLLHEAPDAEGLPTVGDWVAVLVPSGATTGLVHAVLPRTSVLARRQAGTEARGARGARGQLVAANVDLALVVEALDGSLNLRRLERVLTLVWNGGATPAVVLNKADLCDDLPGALTRVEAIAGGAEVRAVSALGGEGLEELRRLLAPGRTAAFLGPSGVGKSSLVNQLLGRAHFATSEVREEDRKGRHTTTHRELVILPGGALLVDGPGMREFGLWVDGDGLDEAFGDLARLAAACRFRDCAHGAEPGCAVRAAVEQGALDPDRLHSFEKLQRELAHAERQRDQGARQEHRRKERSATIAGWERSRSKRRSD